MADMPSHPFDITPEIIRAHIPTTITPHTPCHVAANTYTERAANKPSCPLGVVPQHLSPPTSQRRPPTHTLSPPSDYPLETGPSRLLRHRAPALVSPCTLVTISHTLYPNNHFVTGAHTAFSILPNYQRARCLYPSYIVMRQPSIAALASPPNNATPCRALAVIGLCHMVCNHSHLVHPA